MVLFFRSYVHMLTKYFSDMALAVPLTLFVAYSGVCLVLLVVCLVVVVCESFSMNKVFEAGIIIGGKEVEGVKH